MREAPHRTLFVRLLIAVLTVSGFYLLVAATPSIPYVSTVLVHAVIAIVATIFWLVWTWKAIRSREHRLLWFFVTIVVASGVILLVFGNPSSRWVAKTVHIVVGFGTAAVVLFASLFGSGVGGPSWMRGAKGIPIATLAACVLIATLFVYPRPGGTISNAALSPAQLAGDAMGGEDGPFFPSSAETASGDLIPASFFLESETCERCHADVFEQWRSSAHHFSSFNNQWYRKSIEYMQDVVGNKAPKWCAGCHDPALLFAGDFEQPVESFINSEAAHAGLACVACHSIKSIKSTRGNGGYVIEYPPLHDLVESDNPVLQTLHDVVLHLDPGPHRETFMEPFHTEQSAEFCQTCHKVHLDFAVNSYRWIRGFNTYDNWQASGVSGDGARSFYAPPQPLNCVDCHMQQVASDDQGHSDGFVASHRFAAANTAVPTANGDTEQLNQVVSFLKAGALTVDVFGLVASRPRTLTTGSLLDTLYVDRDPAGRMASSFAVGEESGEMTSAAVRRDTLALAAPLDLVDASVSGGETYRLDVVTRSRIVGHFFPSGTVDAQEAWVELQAIDGAGKPFFWSGFLDDAGRVDPSAHFFKSLMVDGAGNPIDKRNAWSTRSVVYVNLVPPGATDIAHYRVSIPRDVEGPIRFIANLKYRKFTDYYTRFAYAGVSEQTDEPGVVTPHYDNRQVTFDGDLSTVSGPMKSIPDVPVVTMASDTIVVSVDPVAGPLSRSMIVADQSLWGRWTDYGIGLLREGDLRGAERAFTRARDADPTKPDSWVNLARVYVADDQLEQAAAVVDSAQVRNPAFHKAHFFEGVVLKQLGRYDDAVSSFDAVLQNFPRDRVVLNQRARTLFLMEQLEPAVRGFESVLRIDSEDLMAHYNLMLAYRALGDADRAATHEQRYRRYKDNEQSVALSRAYRAENPHDNNEAQAIHEHMSLWRAE